MYFEYKGVMHTDLATLAAKFGYNTEHLRRLAAAGSIYAVKQGHNWWSTDKAILDYRAQDSRRIPGRRKRGEGAK